MVRNLKIITNTTEINVIIINEPNQETKETTNGFTKSYYEKKEKERKVKCHKEKEHTEVKEVDRQRSLL